MPTRICQVPRGQSRGLWTSSSCFTRSSMVSVVDAITCIKYSAPIPVFFQFARYERNFREDAMRAYYAAAGTPKRINWYSTGHELNDVAALHDRAAWLAEHLGLSASAML